MPKPSTAGSRRAGSGVCRSRTRPTLRQRAEIGTWCSRPQSPCRTNGLVIFAALGADCTVLDYSPRQLESERMVAQREGYEIRIIRADMTKPLPFDDEEFDLIFHPVSNCYIAEVEPLFRECHRILKHGGVMLSGLGNEVNYLVNDDERTIVNRMPFNPLVHPEQMAELQASDCGVQFSHTVEEQIGGQLRAGLMLTHIFGDTNGEGYLHELGVECYLATRAVKP